MTPAQATFLAALTIILGLVAVFGVLVVSRSRRAIEGGSGNLVTRLSRPSSARLEVHRWAHYAHRVSGIGIFAFLALHLVDVGLVAISPALYDEVHALYGSPPLRVFEVGLRASERLLWLAVVLTVALTVPAAAVILAPMFR
jgi:succinate dehydrogenase / fumarate reductase cytochrome b subunit